MSEHRGSDTPQCGGSRLAELCLGIVEVVSRLRDDLSPDLKSLGDSLRWYLLSIGRRLSRLHGELTERVREAQALYRQSRVPIRRTQAGRVVGADAYEAAIILGQRVAGNYQKYIRCWTESEHQRLLDLTFEGCDLRDLQELAFEIKVQDAAAFSNTPAAITNTLTQPAATAGPSDGLEEAASYAALLRVYTNGLSDDRIAAAAQVVANKRLSVNNKLYKLDKLLPIPPTASAAVLADLFDISKQAVMKTAWWAEHRSGEGAAKVEQRRAIHHDRAAQLERPDEDD
jgi:hypothetical protein